MVQPQLGHSMAMVRAMVLPWLVIWALPLSQFFAFLGCLTSGVQEHGPCLSAKLLCFRIPGSLDSRSMCSASQPIPSVLGFLDSQTPGPWALPLRQFNFFLDSLISILSDVGPASQPVPSALGSLDFRTPGTWALSLSQIPLVLGFLDSCCFWIPGFQDSRNMRPASQPSSPVFEFLDFRTPAAWVAHLNQFPLF